MTATSSDDKSIEHSIVERVQQLVLETDPAFMVELIDSYDPLFQNQSKNLRDASTTRDGRKMHHAAHSLKGASLNIGANKLAAVCEKIEDLAEQNDFEAIDKLMGTLEEELQTTAKALLSIKTRLTDQKT